MANSIPASAIYVGAVMHHRLQPTRHRFNYKAFSLCLDLDDLAQLNKLKWFSINRFNLFSFHEQDHGSGRNNLKDQISNILCERGYHHACANIKLLCYPRILGYVFNPLSVYFCYDQHHQLQVVLYEVTNTFNQRHTYLLPAAGQKGLQHSCEKLMYVSPFMPLKSRYNFQIQPPGQQIRVVINQFDQQQQLFTACFSGKQHPLTDSALLKLFCSHPLMTVKVIAGIHWEAFRLWRKKLSLQPRDKGHRNSISWYDQDGEHHYESL